MTPDIVPRPEELQQKDLKQVADELLWDFFLLS